jgi:hypothetical protein
MQGIVGLSLIASTVSAFQRVRPPDSAPRRVYAAAQPLGDGTARTFVTLARGGTPTALGVALSEDAMRGLPQHPMEGMPSAAMLVLPLPAEAGGTGFDHVMLDWNPAGHEPEHVYTLPHFDFHFYQITSAERETILPSNPQWAEKVSRFPGAAYVPNGYAAASVLGGVPAPVAGVPLMGMHWLDVESPELQRSPTGRPFTSTFIYGSWDGKFIFAEPMITKAFLESVKENPQGIRFRVGTAARVSTTGLYPRAYSITFDRDVGEYRVTLEDLTLQRSE